MDIARFSMARLAMAVAFLVFVLMGAANSVRSEPASVIPVSAETKSADIPPLEPPSSRGTAGTGSIAAIIEREATRAGLPPEIAEAVTHTESGFNRNAVGADGEIGLMQILPSTARMLGFSGSLTELANPETNIRYGVNYLAQAWRLAGRDLCTTVMKYRAGHGESRFSHLSVDYCRKVRARLSARGFIVTGTLPVATFGNPAGAGACRGRCLAGSRSNANLTALNNKLNQIVIRVTVLRPPMP